MKTYSASLKDLRTGENIVYDGIESDGWISLDSPIRWIGLTDQRRIEFSVDRFLVEWSPERAPIAAESERRRNEGNK